MMNYAICIIAYNRPKALQRLLKSLDNGYYDKKVDLIISVDKSKTDEVEKLAESFQWNYGKKILNFHKENMGLRRHVLECGSFLIDYDVLIVLEDDVSVVPFFFDYVKECSEKYCDDSRIAGISLYGFPLNYQNDKPFHPVKSEFDVYFMNCAQSWGQVWFKKQWKEFSTWYEKNKNSDFSENLPKAIIQWPQSSWLKYHTRFCIENDKYFVYPYDSLSTNNNDIGTHVKSRSTNYYHSIINCIKKSHLRLPTIDECLIKYDGFFEPKFLSEFLDCNPDELCVDLYGNKGGVLYKHFLLSTLRLPYKVVKAYALQYKPIEANILLHISGNDIFLYDTTVQTKPPRLSNELILFEYLYGNAIDYLLRYVSFYNVMHILFDKIIQRFNKHR